MEQRKSGYPYELKKVDKKGWSNAPATRTEDGNLVIQGRSVMEDWQADYMAEFAKVVTKNGGRVLEVGFGMGLSASSIQKHAIDEHVIIEPNDDVYSNLKTFADNARNKVMPVHGMWQEVIEDTERFPDETYEGIFFDASPFDENELHHRQFHFGRHAHRLLRKGGIYTYCNLCSMGALKDRYESWDELFNETQLPHLLEIGFEPSNISFKTIDVRPSKDHPKYSHLTAMIPTLIKA